MDGFSPVAVLGLILTYFRKQVLNPTSPINRCTSFLTEEEGRTQRESGGQKSGDKAWPHVAMWGIQVLFCSQVVHSPHTQRVQFQVGKVLLKAFITVTIQLSRTAELLEFKPIYNWKLRQKHVNSCELAKEYIWNNLISDRQTCNQWMKIPWNPTS